MSKASSSDGVYGELLARAEFSRYGWYTYDADNPVCPDDFVVRDDHRSYVVSVKLSMVSQNPGSLKFRLCTNNQLDINGKRNTNIGFQDNSYDIVAAVSKTLEKVFLIRKCDVENNHSIDLRFNNNLLKRKKQIGRTNDAWSFHRPNWLIGKDFSLPIFSSPR